MDEILFNQIMKSTSVIAGIIGVLFGVDLIFGAKVTTFLEKILDRSVNIVDKTVIEHNPPRRIFGFIILILSLAILFLISKATM